jgi:apolipoprotein N-acyltransferase
LFGGIELVNAGNEIRHFNSTFLFAADGSLTGVYRKHVLVPFGEVYPFGPFFPRLKEYIFSTTDAAELTPGKRFTIFKAMKNNEEHHKETQPGFNEGEEHPEKEQSDFSEGEEHPEKEQSDFSEGEKFKFGVLTCFESGYPNIAREYARNNVHFIVNVTNDYWSLSSVAMFQHAAIAIFRAIETKRPVLRISNGGYSCYINEFGKYSSTVPVFRQGLMTVIIRLLDNPGQTIYTRFGDWLVPASIVIFLFCTGYILLQEYRQPGKKNRKV